MKLYVNFRNEIKYVVFTEEYQKLNYDKVPFLNCREVSDEGNPFIGWSKEKICCHRVVLEGGKVIRYAPYVDVNLLEPIDNLSKRNEINTSEITDTQIAVTETYEKALTTDSTVTDLELAIVELYEMMLGGNLNG